MGRAPQGKRQVLTARLQCRNADSTHLGATASDKLYTCKSVGETVAQPQPRDHTPVTTEHLKASSKVRAPSLTTPTCGRGRSWPHLQVWCQQLSDTEALTEARVHMLAFML